MRILPAAPGIIDNAKLHYYITVTYNTLVGDTFNQKVSLKGYNLLQPLSTFLILSMDCRASPALSTLLNRTYLSANGVVL